MRWVGLAFVIIAFVVGWVAYADPALFPGNVGDRLPRLIYLVMFLLLATGAAYGFTRLRADRRRIIPAILLWTGAFLLIIFLYSIFAPRGD
jgi:hypothetical protein